MIVSLKNRPFISRPFMNRPFMSFPFMGRLSFGKLLHRIQNLCYTVRASGIEALGSGSAAAKKKLQRLR